jgi:GntR family transcriptional regulator of gluconate operon
METNILKPEKPMSAAESVAKQLRHAILEGHFPAGTRVREVQIAEQIGVSRGPVREALRMLSEEGLVVLRQNRGAMVAGLSSEDVVEIYAIRAALATISFKCTVDRQLNSDDVNVAAALSSVRTDALDPLRAMPPGDSLAFVRAELDFQCRLVDVAALERVSAKFRQLTTELQTLIAALDLQYLDIRGAVEKYDTILTALEASDFAAADSQWRKHINEASLEFIHALPRGDEAIANCPWLLNLVSDS